MCRYLGSPSEGSMWVVKMPSGHSWIVPVALSFLCPALRRESVSRVIIIDVSLGRNQHQIGVGTRGEKAIQCRRSFG